MLPSNLSYMDSPQKERDGSKAAATRVNLQTYIRHRKWALGGPVPTWNLRAPERQSLTTASVQLPAKLSASSGVGATRVAMMGDRSLGKAQEEAVHQRL